MNRIYLVVCLLIWFLVSTTAKAQSVNTQDSTASFKVRGVCTMCKNRIEKALKIKGVESAEWDIDTKMLSLVFEPIKNFA